MKRTLVAALLAALVTAGVVACTRVVVLEPGAEPDASLPIDDASPIGGDSDVDASAGDDAATDDASTVDAR